VSKRIKGQAAAKEKTRGNSSETKGRRERKNEASEVREGKRARDLNIEEDQVLTIDSVDKER